jgi:hypothetical protein
MKNTRLVSIVLLTVLFFVTAQSLLYGKDKNVDSGRLLTGKVTDRQDQVIPRAVVYLSNTRTRAVKTFIVGLDGIYRFPALSSNIDYEVYAQYNGHKSDTKTVSQFDNRPTLNINLRIDTR